MYIFKNCVIEQKCSNEDFFNEINKEKLSQEDINKKLLEEDTKALNYGIATVEYHSNNTVLEIDNILVTLLHQAVSFHLPINCGGINEEEKKSLQNYIIAILVDRFQKLSSEQPKNEELKIEVV